MNALEIHGLTKKRGEFVLQWLELTLPAGCIMGLIGENGAGKSTTIRLILNSLGRDGGTIAVYGKDNRTLTALEREDIGVVLDEVGLPEEYGILRGGIDGLDPEAVCGRRATPYGTEYLVRRSAVPAGMTLGQVNIEDLFVFMAKEA